MVARLAGGLARQFDVRSIFDEIAALVALELDFEREGQSTDRIRTALAGDPSVRVPRLHAEYTTGKLLVLEYLDGIKVTELDQLRAAGHDLGEVGRRIGRVYARMIFEQGFFQGDPHPGNLLVLPGNVIGLLDFGLAKELPPGFGAAIAELVTRALAGDVAGAVAAARRAGFEVRDDQGTALPGLVLVLLGDRDETANVESLVAETPITHVPSAFGLIVRVMLLLNGLSHRLAPGQLWIQRAMVEALAAVGEGVGSLRPAGPEGCFAPKTPDPFRRFSWRSGGGSVRHGPRCRGSSAFRCRADGSWSKSRHGFAGAWSAFRFYYRTHRRSCTSGTRDECLLS